MEIRPVTVAYRGTQFVGTSQRFAAGVFTAPQLSVVGNDMISSLLVNEGVSTRICSDNPNTTVGGDCGTSQTARWLFLRCWMSARPG
jgi:hypothetical protein